MTPRMFALIAAFSLGGALAASAQPSSVAPISYPVTQGKTYKFEKIADGVYYASGGVGSNNVVVVNDNDVLIVDTGTTPQATRNFLADIRMLTDKPVKYVVNTHFHYDHVGGNQIFGPDVQIIAHDYVRTAIATFDVLKREPFMTSQMVNVPAQIDGLKQQIATEKDTARKTTLSAQLSAAERNFAQLKELKATAPTLTYSSKLVLLANGTEGDGFVIDGFAQMLKGNLANGNDDNGEYGFRVFGTGHELLGCAAIGNDRAGIRFENAATGSAKKSNLYGNDTLDNCGLFNLSNSTVDATGSFWGAQVGPADDPGDSSCESPGSTNLWQPPASKENSVKAKPPF